MIRTLTKNTDRTISLLAVLIAAGLGGSRWLPPGAGWTEALKVVLGAIAVGVVPGACVLLACRGRARVAELEAIAFGTAISFILVQGLTIAAITLHWSSVVSLILLAAIAIGALIVAAMRGGGIETSPERLWLLAGMVVIGALLYIQGAPYSSSEDQIHVALARRLEFWNKPERATLYFLSNVPAGFYPYPFPAIHYFIALIARVADLDVMFVYHKLRAFWSPVTIALVYLGAETVFNRRLALFATLGAMAFVLNGTFANSHNFFWGQLTPFSHSSDVALGVLLPALIVLTCRFAEPDDKRDRLIYGVTAVALTGTLCIVHAREVVQQLVYLGAMVIALSVISQDRRRARAVLVLFVATIGLALVYQWWHASDAAFVTKIVEAQRERFLLELRQSSWRDLIIGEVSLDSPGGQLLYADWNAIALLLSPLLLLAFPRRWPVRFIGLSILAYLLILRVPLFRIPYILGSYFEITTSGMRNFIFFIHMTWGVVLWVVASMLARLRPAIAIIAGIVIAAVLAVVCRDGELWFFYRQDWFFGPLILLMTAALIWEYRHAVPLIDTSDSGRSVAIWSALIAVLFAATFVRGDVMASNAATSGSALTAPYGSSAKTVREMFAMLGNCVDAPSAPLPFQPEGQPPVLSGAIRFCPPSERFLEFGRQHIPVNAVVASSKLNPYPMSVYFPVRMVAWPSFELTYYRETEALRDYYEFWDRSLAQHHAQPFFNITETRDERQRFLETLAVTHVVVDPNYHETLKPILDQYPDLLHTTYDDGEWTIYEVTRPGR